MSEREYKVTFDASVMYVEVMYEGMSEDVFQEYAYTYADSYEEVGQFVADRLKLFSEKTDAELLEGLQ